MMKVISLLAATLTCAHAQWAGGSTGGTAIGAPVAIGGRPALGPTSTVPQDCMNYFDGCNSCGAQNGQLTMCTRVACKTQLTPYCSRFTDGTECSDAQCAMAHAASTSECTDDSQCAAGSFCRYGVQNDAQWTLNRMPPMECHPYSTVGEMCGGYYAVGHESRCSPELECVNTMGPMIADAPGTCSAACPATPASYAIGSPATGMRPSGGAVTSISTSGVAQRDAWGNCIDPGCQHWFDGCNTCTRDAAGRSSCTEEFCYVPSGPAECRDGPAGQNPPARRDVCKTASGAPACTGPAPMSPSHICPDGSMAGPACEATAAGLCQWTIRQCPDGMAIDDPMPPMPPTQSNTYVDAAGNVITTASGTAVPLPADGSAPASCTTWFDGCNTCTRDRANGPLSCTMMYCFTSGTPECRGWAAGTGH